MDPPLTSDALMPGLRLTVGESHGVGAARPLELGVTVEELWASE